MKYQREGLLTFTMDVALLKGVHRQCHGSPWKFHHPQPNRRRREIEQSGASSGEGDHDSGLNAIMIPG